MKKSTTEHYELEDKDNRVKVEFEITDGRLMNFRVLHEPNNGLERIYFKSLTKVRGLANVLLEAYDEYKLEAKERKDGDE